MHHIEQRCVLLENEVNLATERAFKHIRDVDADLLGQTHVYRQKY